MWKRNKQRLRKQGLATNLSFLRNKRNKSIVNHYLYAASQGGFSLDLWGVPELPSHATRARLRQYPPNLHCLDHGFVSKSFQRALKALDALAPAAASSKADHTPVTAPEAPAASVSYSKPTCYMHTMVKVGCTAASSSSVTRRVSALYVVSS